MTYNSSDFDKFSENAITNKGDKALFRVFIKHPLVYDVYLHNSYNFCMVYYEKTKARTMTSLHPGLDKVGCQVSVGCRNIGPPAQAKVPSQGTGQNSPFRRLHGAHATVLVRGRFRERGLWTFLLYQMSYLAQPPHLM